jgi:hypothetical protein
MDIRCTNQGTLGTVELDFSKDTSDAAAADLATFLADASVKAAVFTFRDPLNRATASDTAAVKACLHEATVPTAGIREETAAVAVRSLVDACLFQFEAKAPEMSAVAAEAALQLKALTDKRPPRIIRAVMTSLRNAEVLEEEVALLEETKLFCTLSRQNRERAKEETR